MVLVCGHVPKEMGRLLDGYLDIHYGKDYRSGQSVREDQRIWVGGVERRAFRREMRN